MADKEKIQWDILEKTESEFYKMINTTNINIKKIHFVTLQIFLEIYVFYERNTDLINCSKNGEVEWIKKEFISILEKYKYMEFFGAKIGFIFDSHENVLNNYNGSYFLRLR